MPINFILDSMARARQNFINERNQDSLNQALDIIGNKTTPEQPVYLTDESGMTVDLPGKPAKDGRGYLGGEMSELEAIARINAIPEYKGFATQLLADRGAMARQLATSEGTPSFSDNSSFRKEYTQSPTTKRFEAMEESYRKITSTDPTGPGDVSMIFAFMKMIDPDSVVRESEFATAEQTANIPTWIVQQYNKLVKTGAKLDESVRQDFRRQAANMFKQQIVGQKENQELYKKLAISNKFDPDKVVPDLIGNWSNYDFEKDYSYTGQKTPAQAIGEITNELGIGNSVEDELPTPVPIWGINDIRTLSSGRKIKLKGEGLDPNDPDSWETVE